MNVTFINKNMNLILTKHQVNLNNIFFCEPIKNNIINEGIFIRLLYSTPQFTLNGIYIILNINSVNIERYYHKHKYIFDTHLHTDMIEFIRTLEENILLKHGSNKTPKCKIYEQLSQGNIKIICDYIDKFTNNLILKISGIWETEEECGITYKFMNSNKM